MKIRISNKFNKTTNSYDKSLFDIKESEKTISGRFTMSALKEEKWVYAHMAFTAFKKDLDQESLSALVNHSGKLIEVSGNLRVEKNHEGNGYFRFVIKSAKRCEEKKPAQSFHEKIEEESDEMIPF